MLCRFDMFRHILLILLISCHMPRRYADATLDTIACHVITLLSSRHAPLFSLRCHYYYADYYAHTLMATPLLRHLFSCRRCFSCCRHHAAASAIIVYFDAITPCQLIISPCC